VEKIKLRGDSYTQDARRTTQTEAERMQVILGHQRTHAARIAGGVPAAYFFLSQCKLK
jgi:hypothetical protein